jgi:hypothetical protein
VSNRHQPDAERFGSRGSQGAGRWYRPVFTASQLDSVVRCPGASTLPQIDDRGDSAAADAGVAEHASLLRAGHLPANLLDWLCDGGSLGSPRFEQPHAVDFTVRSATRCDDYTTLPASSWTCGTPDAFALHVDPRALTVRLRVGDLKTGAGQAAGGLAPPYESWQLRYYALAALLAAGWPSALRLGECSVAWWTRDYQAEQDAEPDLHPTDREHRWLVTAAELSEATLTASLSQLAELTRSLLQRSDVWRPGVWCERCPGLAVCPMHTAPVERLGVALARAGDLPALSDSAIAEVREAFGPLRVLLARAERAVDAYAAQHGEVQLSGGVVLRREASVRRQITARGLDWLREKRPALYRQAVREHTSVRDIAEALGESAPGPRTEGLLAELREIPGALEEQARFSLRDRKDRTD